MKELLTTYWSQVTLLLLGIGYIIKRFLDDRSKKIEINHSLFQKGRLEVVVRFIKYYVDAKIMWNDFKIWEMMNKELTANEIDNTIYAPLHALNSVTYELSIYYDDADLEKFEELSNSMYKLNGILQSLYFQKPELTTAQKVDKFTRVKEGIVKSNDKRLKDICRIVRDIYGT